MVSSLPEYVVLKNKYNGKYLEYVKEGPAEGYVRLSGEDVHSPLSKFHVERAVCDSQLVHLRCCYNNKYLVASNPHWIRSESDKPEEDPSLWSCTLFEPILYAGDDYRFKHVKSGHYTTLLMMGDSDPQNNCLYPRWADTSSALWDVYTVIDWKSLVVLPKHVAFKGDNGNYLCALTYPSSVPFAAFQLQFAASDSGDPGVAHEVFPNPDGSIRLKSINNGRFWICGPRDWVSADIDDSNTDPLSVESFIWPNSDVLYKRTLFWPVKVDDNTIALRSLGNDQFCKRYTTWELQDCLSANISTISKEARLQLTELVLSRDIYNVNYHLSLARRYNEHAVVMGTGAAPNTTDKENSMDVIVAHTETETNSWSGSISFKLGVKTTLKTGVPMIVEGKIEISAELSTSFQWNTIHTKTNTIQTVYKVSVPPMTKVTVTAVGTTAMCDIPFSYTQTDTFMDGTHHNYEMGDGTYTGVNTFNVTYQIKHEKINITE